MKKLSRASLAVAGFALATITGSASAAISTTEITAALTDAGTAAGVVGAAVLVVVVGIKAFKYIKQAM
jgi:hypothetical protein